MKRKLKNPEIRTKDELLNLKRHQYQAELDKTLSDLKKIEQIDKSKLDPELFDELAFHFRRLAAKAHDLSDTLKSISPDARMNPIDPVLLKGIEVELEHTNDPEEAMKIALDHLRESPNYYKDWDKKEKILFQEKVQNNPGQRKGRYMKLKDANNKLLEAIFDAVVRDQDKLLISMEHGNNKMRVPSPDDRVLVVYIKDNTIIPFRDDVKSLGEIKKLIHSAKNFEWDKFTDDRMPSHHVIRIWEDNKRPLAELLIFEHDFVRRNPDVYFDDAMGWLSGPYVEGNPPRMKRTKVSKAGQKRVSSKIGKLIREGYSQKQAAAIAYAMEHKHQIGPRGGRKR